ncbi:MAG: hypothetical protein HRT88_10030 [Lentisphaeraceae bacterium]|nr:hypothetical protein [Lentisphaeraceae bacterium]
MSWIELAKIYHLLYQNLPEGAKERPEFKLFERVYHRQFSIDDLGKIQVNKNKELNCLSLQPAEDLDST